MFAITDYNSDCNTGETDIAIGDDLVANWYNEIRSSSHNAQAFDDGSVYLVDGNFSQDVLADATFENDGADHNYIDNVDAAIVACHGGDHNDSFWVGKLRRENANGECNVWSGGTVAQDEMQVGDGDVENLVIVSCHSMDKSYFDHWSEWKQMYGGVHVINGYHGSAFAKTYLYDDYQDFADDGFDMPLKTAFMDNLYVHNRLAGGEICDQCPVKNAGALTVLGAVYNRDNYYYYSWGDDPAGHDHWARWGISGCDPHDEIAY